MQEVVLGLPTQLCHRLPHAMTRSLLTLMIPNMPLLGAQDSGWLGIGGDPIDSMLQALMEEAPQCAASTAPTASPRCFVRDHYRGQSQGQDQGQWQISRVLINWSQPPA